MSQALEPYCLNTIPVPLLTKDEILSMHHFSTPNFPLQNRDINNTYLRQRW